MKVNLLNYPYPSQRMVMLSQNGMVATSQPLAAQSGLKMLQKGGNAIDAAVATAASLTVLEPTSNGIGGDAFALICFNSKLSGLNASGYSPAMITIEKMREQGYQEMPALGWLPVTVPGAPAAWAELARKYCLLPFKTLLEPAIEYAAKGYPVSPTLGMSWKVAFDKYRKKATREEFKEWFKVFAPHGRAPEIGESWSSPDHAETLQIIAETDARSFYQGKLAELIDHYAQKQNGLLRGDDLAKYSAEWVVPISVNYRGYDIWELPPNGQGLITLLALNIMKGFDLKAKEQVETYHTQIEALKLAFADGRKYITDQNKMSIQVSELLSENYAKKRRGLIGERAAIPKPGKPGVGGTVYLATADRDGNMVSYIQSNYMGFGSGIVVPGTGIALQNRGHSFSLEQKEANCLEPRKRPYHTIIPGFITKDNQPVGPFGVMGGFMQPQGHLQVLMNMIDFNLNPQAALDAPRWFWKDQQEIVVEDHFPTFIARALSRKGHKVTISLNPAIFGRGQIILRDNERGILLGGTEKRTDSAVAVW